MFTFHSSPFINSGAKFTVGLNVKGIDDEKRPLPGGYSLSEYISIVLSEISLRVDIKGKYSANQASSTSTWRRNGRIRYC